MQDIKEVFLLFFDEKREIIKIKDILYKNDEYQKDIILIFYINTGCFKIVQLISDKISFCIINLFK